MVKDKGSYKKYIIFGLLVVCVAIVVVFSFYRAYVDYHSFRGHQNYIRNASNLSIQDWMTPHTVLRHFNVSEDYLLNQLNITNSSSDLRSPISKICVAKKIDCGALIVRLNEMVK